MTELMSVSNILSWTKRTGCWIRGSRMISDESSPIPKPKADRPSCVGLDMVYANLQSQLHGLNLSVDSLQHSSTILFGSRLAATS